MDVLDVLTREEQTRANNNTPVPPPLEEPELTAWPKLLLLLFLSMLRGRGLLLGLQEGERGDSLSVCACYTCSSAVTELQNAVCKGGSEDAV